MKIRLTNAAIKEYKKLPKVIQQKADKQFEYLMEDIRHPSLHAKKYQEQDNLWQARIDKSYRFYFFVIEPDYVVVSIINHPK
jgi:mRNA-degrading endonuclease RelE of RelBE toxin-antitoxin system